MEKGIDVCGSTNACSEREKPLGKMVFDFLSCSLNALIDYAQAENSGRERERERRRRRQSRWHLQGVAAAADCDGREGNSAVAAAVAAAATRTYFSLAFTRGEYSGGT